MKRHFSLILLAFISLSSSAQLVPRSVSQIDSIQHQLTYLIQNLDSLGEQGFVDYCMSQVEYVQYLEDTRVPEFIRDFVMDKFKNDKNYTMEENAIIQFELLKEDEAAFGINWKEVVCVGFESYTDYIGEVPVENCETFFQFGEHHFVASSTSIEKDGQHQFQKLDYFLPVK